MTNHQSPITNHQSPNSDEISLLDYWKVIVKFKKMIAAIVVATSIIAVVYSLYLPKLYKSEATILPLHGGGGGMMASLGGLASLAGLGGGQSSELDKFMAILKSRTLTEDVITRENLMPILFDEEWNSAVGKWKSDDPKSQPTMGTAVNALQFAVTSMDDKKNKTIQISAVFKDPNLAARVANAYVDELRKFINANAFTMAKRNRIFIEEQLEQNKRELLEAGKEINDFYKGGRVSSAESKIDVSVGVNYKSDPELQNQKFAVLDPSHESPFDSAQGGPVTSHEKELDVLLIQKSDLDKKISDAKVVKNVPQQVYLTYLMVRKELLAKVNAMLATQYEMAKIEEAQEDLAFQVIDKAVPPEKRFKPKRAQICMMAFIASLFFAVFLAFFREYLSKMKAQTVVK